MPLLAARGLSFGYGREAKAIADVDLDIRRGEVVGLIGESGSGKSTLARLIAGLSEWERGEIRFHDRPLPAPIRQRDRTLRRAIQIVFQSADVALNPRQRTAEILGRPLSVLRGVTGGQRDREVIRLLEMVELPEGIAGRFPGQLSGGQKQRVNLARALAAGPELVICDEVTSALDAPLRRAIVDLLRRLRERQGLAFLFITHDLSTAAGFADRLVVLHKGRVVEEGPTKDVLERPLHPYTAELVRSVPQPGAGWLDRVLAHRPPPKTGASAGCGFWTRCQQGVARLCDVDAPQLEAAVLERHVACHAPLAATSTQAPGHSDTPGSSSDPPTGSGVPARTAHWR